MPDEVASFAAYMEHIKELAAAYDRSAIYITEEQAAEFLDDAFLDAMKIEEEALGR